MAKKMLDEGEEPTVIFSSPFERCIQTADIMGARLGIHVNVIGEFAPDRPLEDGIMALMRHFELKRFMIVCHSDNSTPAFNKFGGNMGDCARDGDEDTMEEDWCWPPLVKSEVRRLKIDRDFGTWVCRWRLMPSDIGFADEDD